jgi:single-strand DNA-binding protein
MRDVNKVMLMGRLGADPVQRFTKSGYSVVSFPLATSRKFRVVASENAEGVDQEGKEKDAEGGEAPPQLQEATQWHNIVVWGKEGETCATQLRKGYGIFLEGELRSRKYDGKDGTQRTAVEVHADRVSFISRPLRARAAPGAETEEREPGEGLQASEELLDWMEA